MGLGSLGRLAFGGSQSTSDSQNRSFIDPNQLPFLNQLYSRSLGALNSFDPSQLLAGGQGLFNNVTQGLNDTISGNFDVSSIFNPQFSQLSDQITQGIDSRFNQSGRFGGGLHKQTLGTELGKAGGGLLANLINQERGRQVNALSAAPGIYGSFANSLSGLPFAGLTQFRNLIGSPTVLSEGTSTGQSESAGGGLADAFAFGKAFNFF